MPKWIRPTQAIVRKALFDILGQDLEGVSFLDLFSGSGAIGLEAISRGASKATLVEKNPKCADVIRENINLLHIENDESGGVPYELAPTDAFEAIKIFFRREKKFDVVFADPPYGRGLAKKTLKMLGAYDILHPNCMVVIQHEMEEILPETFGRFLLFRKKKYGSMYLSSYKSEA